MRKPRRLAAFEPAKRRKRIELACQVPNFWVFQAEAKRQETSEDSGPKKVSSRYRERMVYQYRLRQQATGALYPRCGRSWQSTRQTPFCVRITTSVREQELWNFGGSTELEQILMLIDVEMQALDPNMDIIVVGAKSSL